MEKPNETKSNLSRVEYLRKKLNLKEVKQPRILSEEKIKDLTNIYVEKNGYNIINFISDLPNSICEYVASSFQDENYEINKILNQIIYRINFYITQEKAIQEEQEIQKQKEKEELINFIQPVIKKFVSQFIDENNYPQVSVKVLQHNIVILFDNKQVVMNIIENEEFKTIVVNTKLIGETFVYNLEDIMKKEDVKLHIMQITKTYLKNDANLQEKLKSMCVKNLRQLAQDIGIDIVNSETEKQYTKGELKNLIETKLELSV